MSVDVERLAKALEAAGAQPVVTDSREEAVADVRGHVGDRPVVIDSDPVLDGVGTGLVFAEDPWEAEVGVTSAVAGVEETGTLVLVADADRSRGTSLLPPVHIALLPSDRLVTTYAEAVSRVAELRPVPSGVQFITGPSSSGDIEMTIVKGVHGPGEVRVVLYPV